ncbi:4Fe-4S dicluster domain-containing protein [Candidatus Aminicenantes bacterium AC-334-K16]|jgi:ferredoxin|nr:4Fe-4S dicluster domain-containing protein [Candidatus Aminicenantes bacterium AC-334-K16]
MAKVKPEFIDRVKKLGAFDISACYSCGNCTAICPLTNENYSFPRKLIRYSLLGIEEKITAAPDLWLCYYCGECTDTCPREADPGGLMMALRRWAIRKYSLGRIADLFYGRISSWITWLILTLIATLGLIYFRNPHPETTRAVPLSFIGLDFLHYAGLVMGIFVAFFALTHIFIMVKSLAKNPASPPRTPRKLLTSLIKVMINEVLLQKRFRDCEESERYLPHLALFWGFAGLFLATILVFGVDFFGFPEFFRPVAKATGIVFGLILIYGAGYFILLRLKRPNSYSQYSHPTDWLFLLWMFLAGLTGFILDIFKWLNLPWPTYIAFAVHLVIVFNLLITAPFTKFAHALYRPLALWLAGEGESTNTESTP